MTKKQRGAERDRELEGGGRGEGRGDKRGRKGYKELFDENRGCVNVV